MFIVKSLNRLFPFAGKAPSPSILFQNARRLLTATFSNANLNEHAATAELNHVTLLVDLQQ